MGKYVIDKISLWDIVSFILEDTSVDNVNQTFYFILFFAVLEKTWACKCKKCHYFAHALGGAIAASGLLLSIFSCTGF